MRREKYPVWRKYMRRSRPAVCPPCRMAISMSVPWPRSIRSVISSISSPSSDIRRSSSSWMRGSSGPSAFLRPEPRASRSRKYRSNRRSNVGRSRDSLTSVLASADLKVSRSSRPISADAARASRASLGEMRTSARLRSPMNSRIRWSTRVTSAVARPLGPGAWPVWWPGSPGEDHRGELEDLLVPLSRDRMQSTVLQPNQPVKGAVSDHVRHLALPPEDARGELLVPLERSRRVGHVPDEMQHAHGAFRAAKAEHDLIAHALAHGLHIHLARVQQMGHRLRHRDPEEISRRRMDVVEVPGAGGRDPELGVLPERTRDAAAALDEDRAGGPELRQSNPRARKPELAELRELLEVQFHSVHSTRCPSPRPELATEHRGSRHVERSSRTHSACLAEPSRSGEIGQHLVQSAPDAVEILLVLDEHGQGGFDQVPIQGIGVQDDERAGPVQAL